MTQHLAQVQIQGLAKTHYKQHDFCSTKTVKSYCHASMKRIHFHDSIQKDNSNPAIAQVNYLSLQKGYFGIESGSH